MKIKDINEDMSLLDLISAGSLVAGGVAGHIGMDKYLQWKANKKALADAKAKREAERAERERQRTDPELIAARKAATNAKRKAARAKKKTDQEELDRLAKDVLNPYATKQPKKKARAEFVSDRARSSEVHVPSRPKSRSSWSSPKSSPSSFYGNFGGGSFGGGFKGSGGKFGGGGASGGW